MIVVHLKRGASLGVPDGVAVTASTFPCSPGSQPAAALTVVTADGRVLAVFKASETAGYTIESADAPYTVPPTA